MPTGDFPERKFDAYETATLEGASNLFESEAIPSASDSTERPESSRTPRREVWWVDQGTTDQNLDSIWQCFEDRLNRSLLFSSTSLLRRINSPGDNNLRRNLHQCPGYLREEITLTSDVSRSAIVSHAYPSQSELCSICGQLVQYVYSQPLGTNEAMGFVTIYGGTFFNSVNGSYNSIDGPSLGRCSLN